MLRARAEAQGRETMGRPIVHGQQPELRAESARRMHICTRQLIKNPLVEAVFARDNGGNSEGGSGRPMLLSAALKPPTEGARLAPAPGPAPYHDARAGHVDQDVHALEALR